MYKMFIEALEEAGIILPSWFFMIVAILFGITLVIILFKKYALPVFHKLYKMKCDIDKIESIKQTQAQSIQASIDGDKKLQEQITGINGRLDKIVNVLELMQKKSDKQELHKLKDQIRQSYAYYHERGKINNMELESLEGLIEAYESLPGGDNSFVHSIVQKEMYTWEVID